MFELPHIIREKISDECVQFYLKQNIIFDRAVFDCDIEVLDDIKKNKIIAYFDADLFFANSEFKQISAIFSILNLLEGIKERRQQT